MMNLKEFTARLPTYLKARGAALAAVAALQLGALGYIVVDRLTLLRTGREIVLPIVPVDPRDLFKGDYVRLGFPISTIPAGAAIAEDFANGKPAFVTIEQQPDDSWTVVRMTAKHPGKVAEKQVVLRARTARNGPWSRGSNQVHFGIERYYVPEGKGGDLERLAREKKLAAIVAVDASGNAAIKGLSSDGKHVYDEPLL